MAAKETTDLIETAAIRVKDGVAITTEMATALAEATQNAMKVRDIAGEVAAASEEQTRAISQINSAMLQVNQGAQSNSAQSEELASTSDELAGLAAKLSEEVGRFKLRKQQFLSQANGLPEGITLEMLQNLMKLNTQRTQEKELIAVKANGSNGHRDGKTILDRDERGYGTF